MSVAGLLSILLLMPNHATPRSVVDFNRNWSKARLTAKELQRAEAWHSRDQNFSLDQAAPVLSSEINSGKLQFKSVTLPNTSRVERLHVDRPWQGICFYHKDFVAPAQWRHKEVTLTLDGAMQISTVVLNGHVIGGRSGGYLPVVADLTPYLHFGSKNVILVRLDNRDNLLVPPGKPTKDLDFLYYGGLYRDAYLTVTNKIHITNPFLSHTPRGAGVVFSCLKASKNEALVRMSAEVQNQTSQPEQVRVKFQLGGHDKLTVFKLLLPNTKETFIQSMWVSHPRLWSPSHPDLYPFTTEVLAPRVMDQKSILVGIRRLKFTRNFGLLVNGKPERLIGTNRHQEYPYIGNALSDNASLRDMEEIKDAGFNCVRLCHYPQEPAVMEACDRLGLFAIVCAPGWQFYNPNPIFEHRVESDIKDMIRWHRNHPCVLAWESALNETYPRIDVAEKWYKAAHSEFTESDMTAVSDYTDGFSWDWPYNQWNDQTKQRPQDAPNKPGYIREYGDWEFGGANSTSRQPMSSGETGQLQEAWNFAWSHNRNRGQWPWTMGDGTWVMYDYHRGYDPTTEHSGMADVFRIPRYIYKFFQSQYVAKPMVFIANQWTPRQSPCKVVVFSNGDRVKLYLNGKFIANQRPDSGPDTPYGNYDQGGNPWDGGNAKHLVHPPFTFKKVPYHPGSLEAVAYRNGKIIAKELIRTPKAPTALHIKTNLRGVALKADGADAVFVYVQLKDRAGTDCFENGVPVHLSVRGPAHLIGPSVMKTQNGIASFMIQSNLKHGQISLVATSPGKKPGAATLHD